MIYHGATCYFLLGIRSHGSRTRLPPKAVTRARFQKRTGDLQSVHTEVLGAFGDPKKGRAGHPHRTI